MVGLYKNNMIAIDRDHYEPDLRGKAFINLKNIPNGHYTIFYIRIGQPISINSRLKVLGRAKGVYVNINREKISLCKKP
jgi:adenosine/AMP kinase